MDTAREGTAWLFEGVSNANHRAKPERPSAFGGLKYVPINEPFSPFWVWRTFGLTQKKGADLVIETPLPKKGQKNPKGEPPARVVYGECTTGASEEL